MYESETRYNALAALGIDVWQPRAFKHPQTIAQSTIIDTDCVRLYARCLVLLFFTQYNQNNLNPDEQKILNGMLGVLNLASEQIMLVKVYGSNPDLKQIGAAIKQWQPNAVLQLNMDISALELAIPYQRTFSPTVLAQKPEYKPQTYKDLLTLRNILHHGTS